MDKDLSLHCYLIDIKNVADLKTLQHYDKSAKSYIDELENIKTKIIEYRKELFKQTQKIVSAQTKYKVTLRRNIDYWHNNKITFTVTLSKVYEDIDENKIKEKHFQGRQRSEAIKEYKALIAQYPCCDTKNNMNI
nr:MAG TPA: hypothetical protein [Caudoviricetes sp.]